MWAPQEVVTEHKERATVIWVILLLGWLVYSLWDIVEAVKEYEQPPTKTSQVKSPYRFPDLEFCFLLESGCEAYSEYSCAANASVHVDRISEHFEEHDDHNKWPNVTVYENEAYPRCRTVELSALTPDIISLKNTPFPRLWADITIFWPLTNGSSGDYDSYWNSIGFYSTDLSKEIKDRTYHPGGYLQYNRVEAFTNVTSITHNDITLKKTQYKDLKGSTSSSFDVNTLSTFTKEAKDTFNISAQVTSGYMSLSIQENDLSFLSVEELNPLDVPTVIGSIGGFWQYVLLGWGIFFVAQNPSWRKARHLGKFESLTERLHIKKEVGRVMETSGTGISAAASFRQPRELDIPVKRKRCSQLSLSQLEPVYFEPVGGFPSPNRKVFYRSAQAGINAVPRGIEAEFKNDRGDSTKDLPPCASCHGNHNTSRGMERGEQGSYDNPSQVTKKPHYPLNKVSAISTWSIVQAANNSDIV